MELNITKDFKLTQEDADKILRVTYLKGYFEKCKDITNGCDIYRYIPSKQVVEFHIKDPLFWVELRLDQFIDCQIDLLDKQMHYEKMRIKK